MWKDNIVLDINIKNIKDHLYSLEVLLFTQQKKFIVSRVCVNLQQINIDTATEYVNDTPFSKSGEVKLPIVCQNGELVTVTDITDKLIQKARNISIESEEQ